MNASPAHLSFIKSRNYPLSPLDQEIFTLQEIEFLKRYGIWMKALDDEIIKPETNAQSEFIDTCRQIKIAKTFYEVLWWKLKERRKLSSSLDFSSEENTLKAIINSTNQSENYWSNTD